MQLHPRNVDSSEGRVVVVTYTTRGAKEAQRTLDILRWILPRELLQYYTTTLIGKLGH